MLSLKHLLITHRCSEGLKGEECMAKPSELPWQARPNKRSNWFGILHLQIHRHLLALFYLIGVYSTVFLYDIMKLTPAMLMGYFKLILWSRHFFLKVFGNFWKTKNFHFVEYKISILDAEINHSYSHLNTIWLLFLVFLRPNHGTIEISIGGCHGYLWSCPMVKPAPCSTSLLRFAISSFKDWIVSLALCSLSWAASTIFQAFSIS